MGEIFFPIAAMPSSPLNQFTPDRLNHPDQWPDLQNVITNSHKVHYPHLGEFNLQISLNLSSNDSNIVEKDMTTTMGDASSITLDTSDSDLQPFILRDTIMEMEQGLDKGLNFADQKTERAQSQTESFYPNINPLILSPTHFEPPPGSKFFVIKSYNELDIIAGFRHGCWSSTKLGNKRLDRAYKANNGESIYLFFSVNGSGHFCALVQMVGPVDFEKDKNCWSDPKWKGSFPVKFLIIKDVPNKFFKNLIIPMLRNRLQCQSSVVTSRDTQELPFYIGEAMVKIFIHQNSVSSFLATVQKNVI